MKRLLVILLLATMGGLALWGCPTKKYIPDPSPPKPEVTPPQAWIERTPGYLGLGREPYVGPRVQFRKMLASYEPSKSKLL